jgi:transketolase
MNLDFDTLLAARKRLLRMHFESGVGHIGGNLSAIDAMLLLFHEFIGDQDRFILSKGHSAGALYVSLWSKGLLDDDELRQFHQDGTRLAGHPPASGIAEIPFATGSLGHGLSLAAGTALARRFSSNPGHTYCMTSDGEWQEGSTWEALIFLNHHRLSNLTVLIDHNRLQGFGSTDHVASMSPLEERLRGFNNIDVLSVPGHDLDAIRAALIRPRGPNDHRPRFLILQTVKGHGVSFMENKMEWHYLPLDETRYRQAVAELDAAK